MQGVVKFFKEQNGYGFINPDEGEKDIFVHITACPDKKALEKGQKVTFDVEEDKKGQHAVNVKIVE